MAIGQSESTGIPGDYVIMEQEQGLPARRETPKYTMCGHLAIC